MKNSEQRFEFETRNCTKIHFVAENAERSGEAEKQKKSTQLFSFEFVKKFVRFVFECFLAWSRSIFDHDYDYEHEHEHQPSPRLRPAS